MVIAVYIFAAMKKLFTIGFLLIVCLCAHAQKRSTTDSSAPTTQGPSSIDPASNLPKNTSSEQKQKKSSTYKTTYDAREKFYARMEAVAKNNRKAEKEMQKPQYSDPSYFGHKKPPVKNPPGKMKYCKECGIRH